MVLAATTPRKTEAISTNCGAGARTSASRDKLSGMPPSEWSPERYERFKDERSAPFFDLLALVEPRPSMRAVDLGCGTGELTHALHTRLGARSTLGVDSSETMLARSSAFASESLRFEAIAIESFRPDAPLDLVFSNAALQWVDDHEALIPRLASFLAPGGQLAFQIPANEGHPSHRAAAQVASEPPFSGALGGFTRVFPNLSIARYALLLDGLGLERIHARKQVYLHHLRSRDEVAEWTKGTLLTAYLGRLPRELRAAFEDRYREVLREALPDDRPFAYPFERILVRAERPAT